MEIQRRGTGTRLERASGRSQAARPVETTRLLKAETAFTVACCTITNTREMTVDALGAGAGNLRRKNDE